MTKPHLALQKWWWLGSNLKAKSASHGSHSGRKSSKNVKVPKTKGKLAWKIKFTHRVQKPKCIAVLHRIKEATPNHSTRPSSNTSPRSKQVSCPCSRDRRPQICSQHSRATQSTRESRRKCFSRPITRRVWCYRWASSWLRRHPPKVQTALQGSAKAIWISSGQCLTSSTKPNTKNEAIRTKVVKTACWSTGLTVREPAPSDHEALFRASKPKRVCQTWKRRNWSWNLWSQETHSAWKRNSSSHRKTFKFLNKPL